MTTYGNDRRWIPVTFAGLSLAAVIAVILSVVVISRTSACTVGETSSHHQLLK